MRMPRFYRDSSRGERLTARGLPPPGARRYGRAMTMTAMVMREHGGPEVLHLEQLPVPEPGPGEVRVRVRAAALNHLDIWTRRGGPAFRLSFPHLLGADIAGVVDMRGPGTTATVGGKV